MSPYYKQTLKHLNAKEDTIEVSMGKYILSHKSQASTLKTLLGSCVALVGFKDGYSFMTHLHFHKDANGMIHELRQEIKMKTGHILEDFHLTITGGNNVNPSITLDPGKKNIEAILQNLERKPDAKIHLGKKVGNVIRLSLISGQIESRKI